MTRNRKLRFFVIIIGLMSVAAILLPACRRVDNVVYANYERVPAGYWDPSDYITFRPYPIDSVSDRSMRYNIVLHLRYRQNATARAVRLGIDREDDSGSLVTDTVILNLDGSQIPIRCSHGVCEISDTIARDIPLSPGLQLRIYPLMQRRGSDGLLDIGLSLIQK